MPFLDQESDEFTNGNEMDEIFEKDDDEDTDDINEELLPGDVVDIKMYAVSQRYYTFINRVISQGEGGGIFSAVPAEIRSNFTNQSNKDNYAYGYFRASQFVNENYTILDQN